MYRYIRLEKRPQRFAGGYASIDEVFDDAVKDAIKKHPGYTMEKRWPVCRRASETAVF
jgi:hypothetical protein